MVLTSECGILIYNKGRGRKISWQQDGHIGTEKEHGTRSRAELVGTSVAKNGGPEEEEEDDEEEVEDKEDEDEDRVGASDEDGADERHSNGAAGEEEEAETEEWAEETEEGDCEEDKAALVRPC